MPVTYTKLFSFSKALIVLLKDAVSLCKQRELAQRTKTFHTMSFYIRYTQDAKADFERRNSFHFSSFKQGEPSTWNTEDERSEEEILAEAWDCDSSDVVLLDNGYYAQELPGLCCFQLEADSLEDALEEAEEFYFSEVYNTEGFRSAGTGYMIFGGEWKDSCPEGDIVYPQTIHHISN